MQCGLSSTETRLRGRSIVATSSRGPLPPNLPERTRSSEKKELGINSKPSMVDHGRKEMKTTHLSVIIFIVLSISCNISFAGNVLYECRVKNIYGLEDDGSLKISLWRKELKDIDFVVSRATGEIDGKYISTIMANSTKVINKGNESWSFKSIAEFDAVNKPFSSGMEDAVSTASFQLLEIQEFIEGDVKPFVAMSMGGTGIVTGVCK